MNPLTALKSRIAIAALLGALLAGCASTENALRDADKMLAEGDAAKSLPTANLSSYSTALERFGHMLNVYKDGDPVLYVQTRNIGDVTNLSNPLAGAEIPGDITEMVRSAVNRVGPRVVYVPYHPDYQLSLAQLGAKFSVTMPDFLITGALTEFDRAISGAGRANSLSISFGSGKGNTDLGFDKRSTAIFSALALDLNLVSFSTQQMLPRIQASNVIKVLNLTSENNAALGFYGDSFGFKSEGKYLQGRHSAIRTLVDLSVLELIGKLTNTPYWRCIPNSKPDPVVISNMKASFEGMSPQLKIGFLQVILRNYGENIAINQQFDEPTRQAVRNVYSKYFPKMGPKIDVFAWKDFEPLFFGVPMPWDATVASSSTPPAKAEPEKVNS